VEAVVDVVAVVVVAVAVAVAAAVVAAAEHRRAVRLAGNRREVTRLGAAASASVAFKCATKTEVML
jgi:hypothetical protein